MNLEDKKEILHLTKKKKKKQTKTKKTTKQKTIMVITTLLITTAFVIFLKMALGVFKAKNYSVLK